MQVVRRCPRCQANRYHAVDEPPKDTNRTLLADRPCCDLPTHITVRCAECTHKWRSRLSFTERGYDD